MANPNPDASKARRAKKDKRRPKPGTVKRPHQACYVSPPSPSSKHHLSRVTADAEEVDTAELCKLTHALSQSASTYLKAVEVGEFEARLEALEGTLTPARRLHPLHREAGRVSLPRRLKRLESTARSRQVTKVWIATEDAHTPGLFHMDDGRTLTREALDALPHGGPGITGILVSASGIEHHET